MQYFYFNLELMSLFLFSLVPRVNNSKEGGVIVYVELVLTVPHAPISCHPLYGCPSICPMDFKTYLSLFCRRNHIDCQTNSEASPFQNTIREINMIHSAKNAYIKTNNVERIL